MIQITITANTNTIITFNSFLNIITLSQLSAVKHLLQVLCKYINTN